MLKKVILLMAAISLSGCYQAVDEAAREQAAAEAQSIETQAAWTRVVTTVPTVRGALAQADYARAKKDLDLIYRELYSVVVARDLSPEIRSRVTRIFPTLIQLQSKVESKDEEAVVLAGKLDDMLRDTNDYLVGSGWLRGGGAGRGVPEEEQEQKDIRDKDRPYLDNPARPIPQ